METPGRNTGRKDVPPTMGFCHLFGFNFLRYTFNFYVEVWNTMTTMKSLNPLKTACVNSKAVLCEGGAGDTEGSEDDF